MTTVSGTSGTTYVAPTTTTDTSSTAATTTTPYDGTAAVAQAQALATQELSSGASGSSGNLLGLSPDILSLLQGADGSGLNSLLGGASGNAFYGTQAQLALYGATQKQSATAQATDTISNLIASNNAISNQASAAAVAAATANDSSSDGTDTSGTDTSA